MTKQEICKDWGDVSQLTSEEKAKFVEACTLHDRLRELNPSEHIRQQNSNIGVKCSCGFAHLYNIGK